MGASRGGDLRIHPWQGQDLGGPSCRRAGRELSAASAVASREGRGHRPLREGPRRAACGKSARHQRRRLQPRGRAPRGLDAGMRLRRPAAAPPHAASAHHHRRLRGLDDRVACLCRVRAVPAHACAGELPCGRYQRVDDAGKGISGAACGWQPHRCRQERPEGPARRTGQR